VTSREILNLVDFNNRNVNYYRQLVETETHNLESVSVEWLKHCNNNETVVDEDNKTKLNCPPDDVQGEIRSSCGLARLLINERFTQFLELIDQCEKSTVNSEIKKVLCSDLQGFWDMVDCQVEDVKSKFKNLQQLFDNNFVRVEVSGCEKEAQQLNSIKKKFIKPVFKSHKHHTPDTNSTPSIVKTELDKSSTKKSAKSTSKSHFAEFRAKMSAKARTSLSRKSFEGTSIITTTVKVEDPIQVEIYLPGTTETPESNKIESLKAKTPMMSTNIVDKDTPTDQIHSYNSLLDSCEDSLVKKTVKRRTSKQIIPEKGETSTPGDIKYNLRSRKSDLIHFESPLRSILKNEKKKQSEAGAIAEEIPDNKENLNDNDDDSFNIVFSPVKWNTRKSVSSTIEKKNKFNHLKVPDQMQNMASPLQIGTPLRHHNTNCLSSDLLNINTNDTPKLHNITATNINSPLIKMAYISSYGKRTSLIGGSGGGGSGGGVNGQIQMNDL
jgi:hypothetical protein